MTRLQVIRYSIWGAAALILLVFALVFWSRNADTTNSAVVTVGGPFTLIADDGTPVTEAILEGKPSLLFFGFTHCPDVCPTALAEVGTWLEALGPEADEINVFLVTVDPARDTVEAMAQYLTAFDPRIVGLTGTQAEIDQMLDAFYVFRERVDRADGYDMNHPASFYVFDADGVFVNRIDPHDGRDAALADIRAVIAG